MPEPQTKSSQKEFSPPEPQAKPPPLAPHIQFLEKDPSPPEQPQQPSGKEQDGPIPKKSFPKGPVILDKNGKPCRSCTSFRDWAKQSAHNSPKPETSETLTTARSLPDDCPPDVEALGRSTWTLLHTIAATYPSAATPEQQREMKTFMTVFARLYPCWVCAEDFRGWIAKPENTLRVEPREGGGGGGGGGRGHLSGRSEFARWMCNAHNDVNAKLGKKIFDCGKVEERWRTGWKDGRCD